MSAIKLPVRVLNPHVALAQTAEPQRPKTVPVVDYATAMAGNAVCRAPGRCRSADAHGPYDFVVT
jgi:hypothetical protein